jgi:hypothetical protein
MPVWLTWLGTRLVHWLIYAAITALVGWCVYVTIIRPHTKPNPTTSQNAAEIVNYQQPKVMFGCMRWELPKEK